MNAQAVRTKEKTAVSAQQSLGVVKHLLSVSFGSIAYIRNLLPEENFGHGRLTGSAPENTSKASRNASQKHSSGITIRTVTRGFSSEADKLLNYLEFGIFDAIERQYLKSFIFAIYLNEEDPTNIVEAYTFNISYFSIPGTSTKIPVMSLDNRLNNLTLSNRNAQNKIKDPVSQSTLKGKAPTLGEVKQSIKAIVQKLLFATQTMEPLPKRRYATFKLFYNDDTPEDYEPPHFRAGDPTKDKYVFATHKPSECPERFSVGSLVTPHHGVDLSIQSVVKYLPNDEEDDLKFIGIEPVSTSTFTSSDKTHDRNQSIEAQKADAEARRVIWDAEDTRLPVTDEDSEGEKDPEFVNDSGVAFAEPLGIKTDEGIIRPITIEDREEAGNAMDVDDEAETNEPIYGKPDFEPDRLGQLRDHRLKVARGTVEPTQLIDATQGMPSGRDIKESSRTDKAPVERKEIIDVVSQTQTTERTVSYGSESIVDTAVSACPCGVNDGEAEVLCEDCKSWVHVWCMGYLTRNDKRMPANYSCMSCRLKAEPSFEFIRDRFEGILTTWKELAEFRRAIKLAETHEPENAKAFRKLSKYNNSHSDQLWQRLVLEGFVWLEISETDKLGLTVTQIKATKTKGKKTKARKENERYIFNKACKKTALYRDYFSPDSNAEKKMLGLITKDRKVCGGEESENSSPLYSASVKETPIPRGLTEADPIIVSRSCRQESQTQDDTQYDTATTPKTSHTKRRASSSRDTVRGGKKIRISVVEENVDIEQ